MKKIIISVTVLLISTSSAFTQVDNKYKLTLKKMLEAGGSEASFKVVIKQMFDMLKQQNTTVPDSLWSGFEKEFSNTSMEELVDMLSPVYQKHMTIADLETITAFYQTPAGKKYAEKTPLIMQESMQVGQQWGMKIGQKFREKLQEKGY
jgi:hypothetical protein